MIRKCFLLLFCTILFSACAAGNKGALETFSVTSRPSGALVRFSSGETCTTPCEVKRRTNQGFVVRISKDGYAAKSVKVTSSIAKLMGEGTASGRLGASVSKLWAGTVSLRPNPVHVNLEPEWTK